MIQSCSWNKKNLCVLATHSGTLLNPRHPQQAISHCSQYAQLPYTDSPPSNGVRMHHFICKIPKFPGVGVTLKLAKSPHFACKMSKFSAGVTLLNW